MSTFRITLLTLWLSFTLIALATATASAMAQPLPGSIAAPDAAMASAAGIPLR